MIRVAYTRNKKLTTEMHSEVILPAKLIIPAEGYYIESEQISRFPLSKYVSICTLYIVYL